MERQHQHATSAKEKEHLMDSEALVRMSCLSCESQLAMTADKTTTQLPSIPSTAAQVVDMKYEQKKALNLLHQTPM